MDLMQLNETEMYNAIDNKLKQNDEAEIVVYCAIYGNHNNSLKSSDSMKLKAFATKHTRNNRGFNDVYLN